VLLSGMSGHRGSSDCHLAPDTGGASTLGSRRTKSESRLTSPPGP